MYNKEKVLQECISVIKDNELTFFADIAIYVEPTLSTLYEWGFEKSDGIKNELAKNKLKAKKKLRSQWQYADSAPALQLAAYKLMAEKDEIEALTMNRVDASVSGNLVINWKEERTYESK